MTLNKKLNIIADVLLAAGVFAGIYFGLKLISGALFPFAFAAAVAIALNSTARRISENRKIKRKYTALFALSSLYLSVTAAVFLTVTLLYKQIVSVSVLIPEYSEKLFGIFSDILQKTGIKETGTAGSLYEIIVSRGIPSLLQKAGQGAADFITGVAEKLPVFFFATVVTVAASFYLSKDYEKITAFFGYILPGDTFKRLSSYKKAICENAASLLKSYLMITAITFVEVFAGLLALRVKNALLLSVLTAAIDILPVLGSGSVLVPLGIVTAISGHSLKAAGIFVLYLVITAVRYFIEPKIVGSAVGIHPLLMLASIFLGLKIFGGAGILLLPSALLLAKCILDEYLKEKKNKREDNEEVCNENGGE